MEKVLKRHCGMGNISLLIFFFVAVSVIGASLACADDTPPNGSYKKTCTSIRYNASADRITSASCKKMSGALHITQFHNCSQCINNGGDISNCDGTIECTGVNIPNVGSYKRSCFCCRMVGSTLSCYCNPKKGKAKQTNLSNAANFADIWNDNGTLKGQ